MQNADLTWFQDPGAVTELLSGAFFQSLGRSTPHQIWSSAMVFTVALRRLFGLDWDALHHTLLVAPNLPATWDHARLRNVPLGGLRLDVEFARQPGHLLVPARPQRPTAFCLVARSVPPQAACPAAQASERQIELPLPAVELELAHQLPLPGSATSQKVVLERWTAKGLELEFEALAHSTYDPAVRLHRTNVRIRGAELNAGHSTAAI